MAEKKKLKIGVLCICLNQPYWSFAQELLWGVRTFFLKGHEVDIHFWSDMPEGTVKGEGIFVYPTEPAQWPLPTLLRYNLFLQQEEHLKDYDYLFYIDVDMRITDWITDEILGEGLTAAQHPMYALRDNLYPPYEPNPESTAYIPLPGKTIEKDGKKLFQPYYYAGGFQGGRTMDFLAACKVMKDRTERDFNRNYIARWNDESHWNRFLYENPPAVVLSPSYIYPDSLISEYYIKLWGRNYSPKIVTITKKFTVTKEGGAAVNQQLTTM